MFSGACVACRPLRVPLLLISVGPRVPACPALTPRLAMLSSTLVLAAVAPPPLPTFGTVYLMRHCARSTFLPALYGGQQPPYLANYSDGGNLPDWGAPPTLCTARGRKIIQGQGRSLRSDVLARMGPHRRIKAIYDAGSRRDNTTAEDFLTGLGLAAVKRLGEAGVFDSPWCPRLSSEAKERAVLAQLGAVRRPANYEARLEALQAILGKGEAKPIQSIPDTVAGGPVGWLGGSFVASTWIETMLLQQGAGLPMGYGRVDAATLYDLLELHVYYRAIACRGVAIEQRGESNLLAHMLRDLEANQMGVSLYVGHDTNLDGVSALLDLAWPTAPPYPANTTVPGGTLRLTRMAGSVVCASFLYTTFGDAEGSMSAVDAIFPGGKSCIPLAQLSDLVKHAVDKRCVRLPKTATAEEETAAAAVAAAEGL